MANISVAHSQVFPTITIPVLGENGMYYPNLEKISGDGLKFEGTFSGEHYGDGNDVYSSILIPGDQNNFEVKAIFYHRGEVRTPNPTHVGEWFIDPQGFLRSSDGPPPREGAKCPTLYLTNPAFYENSKLHLQVDRMSHLLI